MQGQNIIVITITATLWSALTLFIFNGVIASDLTSSVELNRRAIKLAQKGELVSALQMFETATQRSPGRAEYLNNMGVTYMRLGQLDEARHAFERALEAEANNRDVLDNLVELMTLINKRNGVSVSDQRKLKPRSKLTRVPYEKLYLPQYKEYAERRKPFVLTGSMKNWSMLSNAEDNNGTWSLAFFKREFGHLAADFYPHNMRKSDVRPFIVPMTEALNEFERPSGRFPSDENAPGTYIQWNVPADAWKDLREHMPDMPEVFSDDEKWIHECLPSHALENSFSIKLHWRMVLIGTKNAGMFFHKDVLRGSSWQAQVHGAKRWTLCDPIANKGKLYAAGEVNTFEPDLVKHPWFADTECFDDIIRAGEMVFYPRDYWHQTRNLATPTITVSGTLVDANNRDTVQHELNQECVRAKWKWRFERTLCEALTSCYRWWNNNFDIKQDKHSDDSADDILYDEL